MKDYKLECEKLKVELAEVKKQLQYERNRREIREQRADDLRDKFKELIVEVLGR